MSLTSQLCVVTLSVVIAGSFLATSESRVAVQGHGNILNMVYIGAVEGKSYFTEDTGRNWTEAVKFCNAAGMRLATITSPAQVTFLQNAYNNVTFHWDHWVAARDAQDISRYSWLHDNEKVDSSLLRLDGPAPAVNLCLTYDSVPPPEISHFHSHLCSKIVKFLCEINPV